MILWFIIVGLTCNFIYNNSIEPYRHATIYHILHFHRLLELGRHTDKAEEVVLSRIGDELRKLGDTESAVEIYAKLGKDMGPDMVSLHVEAHNWDQAFALVEKNPIFAPLVYLPYAEWLAENDKFVEAQKGFQFIVLLHLILYFYYKLFVF